MANPHPFIISFLWIALFDFSVFCYSFALYAFALYGFEFYVYAYAFVLVFVCIYMS